MRMKEAISASSSPTNLTASRVLPANYIERPRYLIFAGQVVESIRVEEAMQLAVASCKVGLAFLWHYQLVVG